VEEEVSTIEAGRYRVSGKTDLEEFSRRVGVHLGRGLNTTIGGYVSEKLGVIPETGTVYRESGFAFEVTKSDARRVEELEVRREG